MASPQLREHELVEIMARFKKYRKAGQGIVEACKSIEKDTEIPWDTIYKVQRRFTPTTDAATMYLQANALRLAMRVTRRANVDQALNILSRPNIGVLEQPNSEGVGGGGFMIGVAVDSLGGVKVGVQLGQGSTPQALPPAPEADAILDLPVADGLEEEEEEQPMVRHLPRPVGRPRVERIEPVAREEGKHFGRSETFRVAQAKADQKEALKKKKANDRAVRARQKELEQQVFGRKV